MTRKFLTTLQLPAGADLDPSSVGHPFQIGADGATNLVIDTDEIMVRGGSPYLNVPGTTGVCASTPDAPDLSITTNVTWKAKVRADDAETAGSRYLIGKAGVGQYEYYMGPTYSTQLYGLIAWADANAGSQLAAATTRTLMGLTPPGADRYVGATITNVGGVGNLSVQHIGSLDGVSWYPIGSPVTTVPTSYLQRDTTSNLLIGSAWQGRIYWAQVESINAQLVFPGVAGNYLSVPYAANLDITGDIELVARVTTPTAVRGVQQGVLTRVSPGVYHYGLTLNTNGGVMFMYTNPVGGVTTYVQPTVFQPLVNGQTVWLKITRQQSTGNVDFYWAADQPTEPTTWTKLGASVVSNPGQALSSAASGGAYIGALVTTSWPMFGRIARAIIRNGIGGTTVLDVNENNAGALGVGTTFPATSGQTVTIVQTAGNNIVQPQPESLIWRFDAADYPGSGTSWTDPRGRSWSLLSTASIVAAPSSSLTLQANGSTTNVGGPLMLPADPTAALQAATKQYVDAQVAIAMQEVVISATDPIATNPNAELWYQP